MPIDRGFVLDGCGPAVLAQKCWKSRAMRIKPRVRELREKRRLAVSPELHISGADADRQERVTNNDEVTGFSEPETGLGRFNA
jgi:hypothetical protein